MSTFADSFDQELSDFLGEYNDADHGGIPATQKQDSEYRKPGTEPTKDPIFDDDAQYKEDEPKKIEKPNKVKQAEFKKVLDDIPDQKEEAKQQEANRFNNVNQEAESAYNLIDYVARELDLEGVSDDSIIEYARHGKRGLVQFFNDLIEANKGEYRSGLAAQIDDYISKGGQEQDVIASFRKANENIDIIRSMDDHNAVGSYLKITNPDMTDDEIRDEIEELEDMGRLQNRAVKAREKMLVMAQREHQDNLERMKQERDSAIKAEEQAREQWWNQISQLKDIDGIQLRKNDPEKMFRYFFDQDNKGMSQWQKDLHNNEKAINLIGLMGLS